MVKDASRDLAIGSVARHVLALAVPAILSTIAHNLYGLNDVFFAKFTGLSGQTAVSSNLFVLITIFGFIQLPIIGTLTLVARRSGAGNPEGADRAARQGLLFAGAVSLVIAAAGEAAAPLLPRLMQMTPAVAADSILYLRILFVGLPFLFLMPTAESIFRARGDTRTP
ncbi:MAG: MATE family efflux transporter, partial [Planctomycetota bacterium]